VEAVLRGPSWPAPEGHRLARTSLTVGAQADYRAPFSW